MGGFGKRGMSTARRPGSARISAPAPAVVTEPTPSGQDNLISNRDLRQIEKGQVPNWCQLSRSRLLGLVVGLPLVLLLAFSVYGGDVVRDLRHAGTFAPAPDLRATEGKCSRYVFLVSLCSAKITSMRDNQQLATSRFMVLLRSTDGEPLVPVRSAADPSVVGIRYAVSDVLVNRTLSLLAVFGGLGAVWLFFVHGLRKGRYIGGAAHQAVLQHLELRAQPA